MAFEGRRRKRLTAPADIPSYLASPVDVAHGLLADRRHESRALWARVVVGTGIVDLSELEEFPEGNLLLEAIWDAADGRDLDTRTRAIASKLTGSN
jgi:hypothetical protein